MKAVLVGLGWITKYRSLDGSNYSNLSSHSSGGGKVQGGGSDRARLLARMLFLAVAVFCHGEERFLSSSFYRATVPVDQSFALMT